MLERWVASVFTTYLGKYIKNLDKHDLQVSMWNGEVVLHDLELAPEALDELDLPVIIDRGVIGRLRIEIPWKNFYSGTCKIEVDDVQIAVLPIKSTPWNEAHERKKRQMRKRNQLAVFESTRRTKEGADAAALAKADAKDDKDEESDGFGARIARHILSSLQVSITNVVLRYEDACTDPRRPVSWTVKLGELSVVPDPDAEEPAAPAAADEAEKKKKPLRHFRVCKMEGLSFSIDHLPVAPRLTGPSKISSMEKWKEVMAASRTVPSQLCTPAPVDVHLKITTQPSASLDLSHPRNTVDGTVSGLGIRLKRWQYDSINRAARYVADFKTLDKFRQYRPSVSLREDPKSWWLFSFQCVRLVARETRGRTQISWKRLQTRNENKEKYVALFKRSQGATWLRANTKEEEGELAALEECLDIEAIIYFRRLAYFQLRIERQTKADDKPEPAAAAAAPAAGAGIWGWLGWSGEAAPAEEKAEGVKEEGEEVAAAVPAEVWELIAAGNLTVEQRAILHEELGLCDVEDGIDQQGGDGAQDVPATYVQTKIQIVVRTALVEMCENTEPPRYADEFLGLLGLPVPPAHAAELATMSAVDLVSMGSSALRAVGVDTPAAIYHCRCVFGLSGPQAVTRSVAFASFELSELTCRYSDMAQSWKFMVGLRDLSMNSASLSGSHYTSLMKKVANDDSQLLLAEVGRHTAAPAAAAAAPASPKAGSAGSGAEAGFQQNRTTYTIDVHLRPMDAVVDVLWMQTVCAFWGVGVYGSCSQLEVEAKDEDEDATSTTPAAPAAAARKVRSLLESSTPLTALNMALERESNVIVSVVLEQPCLVIPSNCSEIDSVALLALAETVVIQSNPTPVAGRAGRIVEANALSAAAAAASESLTGLEAARPLTEADFYNHYLVKSEYGSIVATTTKDWLEITSMESYRDVIAEQCGAAPSTTASSMASTTASLASPMGRVQPELFPIINEITVQVDIGASLVPACKLLPKVNVHGDVPNFVLSLSRTKVYTLERAITNIVDFTSNVTGRGNVNVARAEAEDEAAHSCSTFALTLGPMQPEDMDLSAVPDKSYIELDSTMGHVRIYDKQQASRVAVLIDLSTRQFNVDEPPNALMICINSKEALWIQFPSQSMHLRWLRTLKRIKGQVGAGSLATPLHLGDVDAAVQDDEEEAQAQGAACARAAEEEHQEWINLSIALGDMKMTIEDEEAGAKDEVGTEWNLLNCKLTLCVTGHDSKLELESGSIFVVDSKEEARARVASGTADQSLASFSVVSLPASQNYLLWSNDGEPGFSFWMVTMMPTSRYYDPTKPNDALMQSGLCMKNMGVALSSPLAAALEMVWDYISIFLNMASKTKVYTARDDVAQKVVQPPELPRPFEQKQGFRFVFEVEGEVEIACLREDGTTFMNMAGEDFFLQFHDTPYGIATRGTLGCPVIEDMTGLDLLGLSSTAQGGDGRKRWAKFVNYVDSTSHLAFEYTNFQNRGALKGDIMPDRPSLFHGISFTHQLKMNVAHCEVAYFQTFFWSLMEYLKTGLCTRLSFLSWRPVFTFNEIKTRGESFVSPYATYDPTAAPTVPYYDLLKFVIEVSDCTVYLPPSRDSENGVFKGVCDRLGVYNDLERTKDGDVLLHTVVSIDGFDMKVPEEDCDGVPNHTLFREPFCMDLITTHAMVDPHQRYPKTKLALEVRQRSVMYLTEDVYCAFLHWMTNSLMEKWEPRAPAAPPGPPVCEPVSDLRRYNHFTWDIGFDDLTIIWLARSIPRYTLSLSLSCAIRWYTNDDFENDVVLSKLSLISGVEKADDELLEVTAAAEAGSGAARARRNSLVARSPDREADVVRLGDYGMFKFSVVWFTPEDASQKRVQTLAYDLTTELCLTLDHVVLVDLVDSLLGHRACRSGAYQLIGYVKPEGGWPEPGEAFPPGPPQEQVVCQRYNMSSLTLRIPKIATFNMSLVCEYHLHPSTETSLDVALKSVSMVDDSVGKVVMTEAGDEALKIRLSRKGLAYEDTPSEEEGKPATRRFTEDRVERQGGWDEVTARLGQVRVVATVGCFSSMYEWMNSSSSMILAHAWSPTPQHRTEAIQQKIAGAVPAAKHASTASAHVDAAALEPAKAPPVLRLPELSVQWHNPCLAILVSNRTHRGFLMNFGEMSVASELAGGNEKVTMTLNGFGIESVFRNSYVLSPMSASMEWVREWATEGVPRVMKQQGVVRCSEILSYFDFTDVRTLAAVAYDCSSAFTVSSSKKGETMSRAAARKAATQIEETEEQAEAEDTACETLNFSVVLPLVSVVVKSGGRKREKSSGLSQSSNDLPLPSLKEPDVDAVIAFTNLSCTYTQDSGGGATTRAELARFNVTSGGGIGGLICFDDVKVEHAVGVAEGTKSVSVDVGLGDVKVLIVPIVYFSMMNFVYLPYAAATMPDTFASPDVIEIDNDFDLQADMVLNNGKMMHISNKRKNFIRLTGNLHELHLVGDRPLIRLDAGVTLMIVQTKLYLYNKELSDFVEADDGAYVHAPTDRNKIDKGVPPIPAWSSLDAKQRIQTTKSKLSTRFRLSLYLPEVQERPAGAGVVAMQCVGEGSFTQLKKAKGDNVLEHSDSAAFALRALAILPRLRHHQQPRNAHHLKQLASPTTEIGSPRANQAAQVLTAAPSVWDSGNGSDSDSEPAEAETVNHVLQPVEKISITMERTKVSLTTTDFHFRLSSEDAALLMRCVNSMQSALAYIGKQAKLKIERADEDIIRDAIIKAQQDIYNPQAVAAQKGAGTVGAAAVDDNQTMAVTFGKLDILVVEDSSGFDIPLFFMQMVDISGQAELSKEFQSYHLQNVSISLDYYNLESCEWEKVLSEPIVIGTRLATTGAHKKDLQLGISSVSALITPQLIKTLTDANKFAEAFSGEQPSSPSQRQVVKRSEKAAVQQSEALRVSLQEKERQADLADSPPRDVRAVGAGAVKTLSPPQAAGAKPKLSVLVPSAGAATTKHQSTQFLMYEVTNQTGYKLDVYYTSDRQRTTLPNRGAVSFNYGERYGREVLHCVPIAIEGQRTQGINVGRVGTTSIVFDKAGHKVKLFCSVKLTETGRKKVTMSSSVTVVNETPVALQITAREDMIAKTGESVSIPHEDLGKSFLKVMPVDVSPGFLYSAAQLGLPYGVFHKLHREVFTLTSQPIIPETTITQLDKDNQSLPPEFTCFVEITTDSSIGNTTVSLFPVLSLQNLTGLPLTYTLRTIDASADDSSKGVLSSLFRKSKKGTLDKVAEGVVATDETAQFTEADPYCAMYVDLEVTQPTGETLKRDPKRHSTPFLIRAPAKSHQGRCSHAVLSDSKGRNVYLTLEYSARMVTISCPLWVINQTTFYLELALHNPMKLSSDSSAASLTAGQATGEGIKPGRHPFLMAPDMTEKQVDHVYCRILRGGGEPQWSSKIDVSNVGVVGTVECQERTGELPKTIAYNVEFPWGKVATRTRVIKFTPRWIMINRTHTPVLVRHEVRGAGIPGQSRPKSEFLVHPHNAHQEYEGGMLENFIAVKNYYAPEKDKSTTAPRSKSARFCKPFLIDKMGEKDVMLMCAPQKAQAGDAHVEHFDVVRAAIFRKGSIIYITIDSLVNPPYIIENRTKFPVYAQQQTEKATLMKFPPLTTKAFTWEFLEKSMMLVIRLNSDSSDDSKMFVNLDPKTKETLEETKQERVVNGVKVYLRVRHKQPTTKISLTMDNGIDRWFLEPPLQVQHKLSVAGVQALLMMNQNSEIAHLSLMDIRVLKKVEGAEMKMSYSVKVGTVQLDDQRTKADFNVVLCNKIPRDRAPFFSLNFLRRVDRSSAAIHVLNGQAKFQPLDVRMQDTFLFQLLLFYRASMEKIITRDRQVAKKYYTAPAVDASFSKADAHDGLSARPLYLEKFTIEAINVHATLMRTKADRDKDFFKQMLGYNAVFVRGFDDMLLVWPKIDIEKHCNRGWLVATMLKDKYYSDTIGQLLRVAPGVATVRTVVTDLLKTLPSNKDDAVVLYQTPRKRIKEPTMGAAVIVPSFTQGQHGSLTSSFSGSPVTPSSLFGSPASVTSPPLAGQAPRVRQVSGPPPLGARTPPPVRTPPPGALAAVRAVPPLQPGLIAPKGQSSSRIQPPAAAAASSSSVGSSPEQPASLSLMTRMTTNESYFGAHTDEDQVPFHETNSALMTKARAQAVLQLKKKSWERFHPTGGRTTWEEYAQACTWEEFHQHSTAHEFKAYVHLSLDHYIRTNVALPRFELERQACRCGEIERFKEAMGEEGLQPPSHDVSKAIGMTWYEFAHHTTWDEFKTKTSDDEFSTYVTYSRDCLLGATEQFKKLDRQELVSLFQM